MKHSPYLSAVLDSRMTHDDCVQGILRELNRHEDEFEAIACSGVSGLLMGPTIAYLMGKRLAVVRKESDKPGINVNHAEVVVEHNLYDGDRVVIIDDLIASGKTVMRIQDAIRALRFDDGSYTSTPVEADCVGYYMYRDHRFKQGAF